jgi:hypothetical protein
MTKVRPVIAGAFWERKAHAHYVWSMLVRTHPQQIIRFRR